MDWEAFYLLLRLLHLMVSLIVIGEPLRVVLSKYTGLFKRLDFPQICVVDVYLAGVILYTIAMIPLHMFTSWMLWGVLAICGLLSVILHSKALKSSLLGLKIILDHSQIRKATTLKGALLSLMFFSMLWLQVLPISGLVYGNVHDSALFGLFVKLNLENQQTPVTMQPYGTEGIIYPQGFFVIGAFATILSGFSAAEVTLRITPLFMALAVLGAYYLGKTLAPKSHLDISMAFTFWCVSRWPRLLLWGSNAFVAAFPLYFVCLSLFPQLIDSFKQRKRLSKTKILAIGILSGYLGAVHLVFLELLFVWVVLIALLGVLRERKHILARIEGLLIYCVFTFIPIGASVYRFFLWHHYPGHNLGLPSDVILQTEEWVGGLPIWDTFQKIFDWTIVSDWISPHPLIRNLILGLIIVGTATTLLLQRDIRFIQLKKSFVVAISSIAAAGLTIILTTKEATIILVFLSSWAILLVQLAEMTVLGHTSFHIIIGIFSIMLYYGIQRLLLAVLGWYSGESDWKLWRRLPLRVQSKSGKTSITTISLASVMIFAGVFSPFIYFTFTYDQEYIRGQYSMFCVTTEDDRQLMLWMKDGVPTGSTILINPNDAGGFVPVVTDHKAIFQPGASRYSMSYETLVNLIGNYSLDATAFDLIQHFNVTHVFLGSEALFEHDAWNPLLFLGNPNFKLLKNFGKSYLFEIDLDELQLGSAFSDSFERDDVESSGWEVTTSPTEGVGNVSTTSERSFRGTTSAKIVTSGFGEGFWYSIQRRIYLPSTNDTLLSFYVEAADGFNSMDNLMVIISEISWIRQLFFVAIPNRENKSVTQLPVHQGHFQFRISELWQETYNSSLPSSLYLQVLSYDSDGIENVAYVDLVEVKNLA